jgi:hypothetical protein
MSKMIKYPKIKQLGHKENQGILHPSYKLTLQEKLDGSNTRYMVKDGKLIFGSRNCILGDGENESYGQFTRAIKYIKNTVDINKVKGDYIFFGENIYKHTVNYKWDDMPPFIGFDVYDLKKEKFLPCNDAKKMFENMGLTFVPIIKEGYYKKGDDVFDLINNTKKYPSKYAVNGVAEGIVIKNVSRQIYAKKYSEGFKERFKEKFGKPKKESKNHNERFVAIYVTNQAIEKQVFKLIDDGHDLDRTMMKHLPMNVWFDIWEEEWQEIIMKRWVLDLNKIKKMTAKRCLHVLDNMIINNALMDSDDNDSSE